MNKFKKTNKKFSLDDSILSSKFDFVKNLKWFLIAPVAILLIGITLFFTIGFNLGIDFTGGTTMTIYRNADSNTSLSTLDKHEDLGKLESTINKVLANHDLSLATMQDTTADISDLGISNGSAVIIKYQNDDSLSASEIEILNETIRQELLVALGYVDDTDSIDENFLIKNSGVTTAAASAELLMNSFIALIVAVALILIYIAFRFEITSGLAAILALFHDLLVTTSIVLMFGIEINVAFIAALITILGYSINNTIIIFDRMRDDLRTAKKADLKINNKNIANSAVKQTMLRSILTTVTTFVMIFMITVIGVADIREFAFPIMIGVLAGFYSSVFITPGLWSIAYRPKKKSKIDRSEVEVEAE